MWISTIVISVGTNFTPVKVFVAQLITMYVNCTHCRLQRIKFAHSLKEKHSIILFENFLSKMKINWSLSIPFSVNETNRKESYASFSFEIWYWHPPMDIFTAHKQFGVSDQTIDNLTIYVIAIEWLVVRNHILL